MRPRTWEEFCKNYPVKVGESYITTNGVIYSTNNNKRERNEKNWIVSQEEAEAFLALMQLRQLRKAWVGDWKSTEKGTSYGIISKKDGSLETGFYDSIHRNMLFPTNEMAEEFLNCFKDLCETAKILL